MKLIAVTQRVVVERGERRDSLDQRWYPFLEACGLTPLLLPNSLETTQALIKYLPVKGFLLTGGNDLATLGGDAPERDMVEMFLIEFASRSAIPLMGVCRGMQMIQAVHGLKLERVPGHVAKHLEILVDGEPRTVNSYHEWGTTKTLPSLVPWAVAQDGVVKAIRHQKAAMMGMMWHPERNDSPSDADTQIFAKLFST